MHTGTQYRHAFCRFCFIANDTFMGKMLKIQNEVFVRKIFDFIKLLLSADNFLHFKMIFLKKFIFEGLIPSEKNRRIRGPLVLKSINDLAKLRLVKSPL